MRQLAMFLLVGGFAAAVNVASRIVYSWAMPLAPLAAAVVLAYLTGMVVAFCLNRWLVFQNASDDVGRRAGRFAVVNALAVLQTLAVTLLGARALRAAGMTHDAETMAHVVGVAVPVFTSYLMHKRWTFSSRPQA